MLHYFGAGERQYQTAPIAPYARKVWEFQAVLRGVIGLWTPGEAPNFAPRTLWLFPPGHCHGWAGRAGRTAEVVVFHFSSVPEPLALLVRRKGFLAISLTEPECRRLRFLGEEARRYWHRPSAGMMMCFEHILNELSLLLYERSSPARTDFSHAAADRVEAVLAWFDERLPENPTLEDAARAHGLSPAHLRRLFHEVLQTAPKAVIDQLRFRRALHLMSHPEVKLSAVSEACGFEDPSSFSRAFKAKFGCSPARWRG